MGFRFVMIYKYKCLFLIFLFEGYNIVNFIERIFDVRRWGWMEGFVFFFLEFGVRWGREFE